MSKLSLVLLLGLMSCLLEEAYSNNFYYYPNSQPALNYQYQPFSPYVYPAVAVPVDCDKGATEGGAEGGESSSSESSSGESTEGGSTEGSSESSSAESKEGGESESSSSSSEEGGKKEEGPKEEKKDDSKNMVPQYVFPPISSYPFAPQTAQQVVYTAPSSYPYMPYKTYSVVSQPATYSVKSSGYNTYPYYSLSRVPVSGAYSAPVSARIVSSPNVARIVSPSTYVANSYPAISKTISFAPASGVGGPAGYWNGNAGYYRV